MTFGPESLQVLRYTLAALMLAISARSAHAHVTVTRGSHIAAVCFRTPIAA